MKYRSAYYDFAFYYQIYQNNFMQSKYMLLPVLS